MSLTLDPQTEQRIQQEVNARHYATPTELINFALDHLPDYVDPFEGDREEVRAHIEEGWQQAQRGEFVSSEELDEMLAQLRLERQA